MTPLESFVAELRMERLRRRLRQGAVAEHAGLMPTQLSAFENGRQRPSDASLRRWAYALGVEVPEGVEGWTGERAPCGTDSAYNRHLRRDETPDPACREAHAAAQAKWRARRAAS